MHAASRRGDWAAMPDLVSDDVLGTFAAVGSAGEVAAELRSRFTGLVTRLSFSASYPIEPAVLTRLVSGLRGA